jgi:putative membrane protein
MHSIRTVTFALGAAAAAFSIVAGAQQAGGLAQQDRDFMENAIQGSYAEIEASKLALKKDSSPDVRKFANTMITDHGKMVEEARKLAQEKGYTPPDGPSVMQKGEATALKALSGGAFDASYVNRIGVAAHESTIKQFEEAASDVKDPDIKAMIQKTLPKLRDHLQMARALDAKQEKQ